MNEPIVKEEVIEEEFNFTFKNGEYVEVKQEEIERKPENLLEKEVKTEAIDIFEKIESDDEFSKDVPKVSMMKCEICQKSMAKKLLILIKLKIDQTVLSDFFEIEGSLEAIPPYVCVSHIQKIIDDNDGKLKSAKTPSEKRLRLFIRKNKKIIRAKTASRRTCQICQTIKDCSGLYKIYSKSIRIVLMIGCILRGTHSVEQAMFYVTNEKGDTCYLHCKETIDMIFENLGVRNVGEFLKSTPLIMLGLMDIAKKIDSNFTGGQFILAFRRLFLKNQKFESNL
ncbi:hypothetical protein B9Z55_021148 [Caenorhabditis nigoni]|uniref:Lin-15A/B-like domain-containing protein n=1 Tax=Caenorhabditis nigoni TaxID=1611254 RepID=A0A2G5TRK8_9PELO|nr:hypothetical protein B9Z55_021148 [Caenorhabditis nigoni]